jgi:hypothetical protein
VVINALGDRCGFAMVPVMQDENLARLLAQVPAQLRGN